MKKNPSILIYTHKQKTIIGSWMQNQFYDELKSHNVSIYEFDFGKYHDIIDANNQLLKFVEKKEIDLFMTSFDDETLFVSTLVEIKKKGIKTMLFCTINYTLPYRYKKTAKFFDLIWVTANETKRYFSKLNSNTIFMPFAANPNINYKIKYKTKGICFIGTPYGCRVNDFNILTNNGIDVYCTYLTNSTNGTKEKKPSLFSKLENIIQHMIYKHGRKLIFSSIINKYILRTNLDINSNLNLIDSVDNSDIYDVYSNYSLCFSSTTAGHTGILKKPLYICNLRCFEIPMSGGIIFAQYNPELDSYFKNGVEAVYYHNKKDMLKKAKYYLDINNRDELVKIKYSARKKAEQYHTWWIRFKTIFDNLSIDYTDE